MEDGVADSGRSVMYPDSLLYLLNTANARADPGRRYGPDGECPRSGLDPTDGDFYMNF